MNRVFRIASLALLLGFVLAAMSAATVSAQQQSPVPLQVPAPVATRQFLMSETIEAKLVFGVLASPTGNWQLATANINGANFKFVTKDDAYRSEPFFSPWVGGKPTLALLNLESGAETPLNIPGYAPAWSPDGKKIAYLDQNSTLSLLELDGLKTRSLGQGFPSGSRPAWSPDSVQLALAGTKRDTSVGVAIFGIDGKGVRQLVTYEAINPSWSGDGKTVVFQAAKDGQPANTYDLYVVNAADGKDEKRLTKDGGSYPAFAPDSLRIAFVNKGAIYTIYRDTSGFAIATDLKTSVQFPSWMP
jgi:hypothetical protein